MTKDFIFLENYEPKLRQRVKDSKRIVIKVGTSSIMINNTTINYRQIDRLAFVITSLMQLDKEIILVTSGAMGVGCSVLGIPERPKTIPEQQAVSSVGQGELINLYSRFFDYYHQKVGQILLTKDIVEFPESRQNTINAFETLLKHGIVPIVNENDAVSIEELDHQTKFGDNDTLSAIVATITESDLLIILSDVDGFYDKNPMIHSDAKLITQVFNITEPVFEMAGVNITKFSTGGMYTKLQAGQLILEHDQQMVIASTKNLNTLFEIIDGSLIGTYFAKEEVDHDN